jgi:hypothetical protein
MKEFAKKALNWVSVKARNLYGRVHNVIVAQTHGPLVALLLLLVLLFVSIAAHAQMPNFPVIVGPDSAAHGIFTDNPRVRILCQADAGPDAVFLCQAWGMVGPGTVIPVSGAVYCFQVESKEVIREGNPEMAHRWACGDDRSVVAEEAKRVGKEVKTWGRPIRPGEVVT